MPPSRERPRAGDPRDGADREFGWRGWVLVATILLALVVAPVVIAIRPPGTGYTVALVILPLVPAIALATVAVWAALRG